MKSFAPRNRPNRLATPTVDAVFDGMRSLRFSTLCDVIAAHIEALPHDEIDPIRLEALSNALGRIAHMAARERA